MACAVGAEEWIRLGNLLGMEGEGAQKEMKGEALDDQEILECAEKIKTLVESGKEKMAIDLVRSLNEPKLYFELLKGCSIVEDGFDRGQPSLPDWYWINLQFLLLLIQHCSEDSEIHPSLRKANLTSLRIFYCSTLTNLDGLSGLTNLRELVLARCSSLTNVDGLSGLIKLKKLDLVGSSSLTNLNALRELANLRSLDLYGCSSLTNVDSLSGLTNLTSLDLNDCASLTNDQVDELRKSLPDCEIDF